jgi:hypothetical protein
MHDLKGLLRKIITGKSRDNRVGLLLSAGMDSVSTGIACQEVGKEVHAYTYELQGYRSREREKVEVIARHFGWRLDVITVPTYDLAADFKRLAIQYGCKKKVQFEVTLPLLYVIPEIEERDVWTGFNADDHYGNTRGSLLDQARLNRDGVSAAERKRLFDEHRRQVYQKFDEPGSADTWWFARDVATRHGKELLDPYLDPAVREYFSRFDHDALSPLGKPIVREALAEQLMGLPDSAIAKGVRLQIGGRVDELFRTLLANPDINRFEAKYTTVSALCQGWGREVEANPATFARELDALPCQPRANVRVSGDQEYRPYLMADVMEASSAEKFTVISTFAGGGGSSTGYRLAGGKVLLASEFVPEAGRTYRINFRDCVVDPRDSARSAPATRRLPNFWQPWVCRWANSTCSTAPRLAASSAPQGGGSVIRTCCVPTRTSSRVTSLPCRSTWLTSSSERSRRCSSARTCRLSQRGERKSFSASCVHFAFPPTDRAELSTPTGQF